MSDETQPFAEWIGRKETVEEEIAAAPAQAAAATLDDTETIFGPGDELPAAVALVLLPAEGAAIADRSRRAPATRRLPAADPAAATDVRRLPPSCFHTPLRIGRPAQRRGVIQSVSQKAGRSGTLAFVTVGYEISQEGEVCIERSRTSSTASRERLSRRRSRRRCRHCRNTPGRASSPPIRCCCSASRHSPSTVTASTTTGRMPRAKKATPASSCMGH